MITFDLCDASFVMRSGPVEDNGSDEPVNYWKRG
jgi:hypothetical protein